jgi:hypothetical protein
MSVTRSMRWAALMLLGLAAGLFLAVAAAQSATPHSSPGQIAADDVSKGGRIVQDNWAVLAATTYQGTGVLLRYSTRPSL